MECKKKAASDKNKKIATKRKLNESIKVLKDKKTKLATCAAQESLKLDMEIAELEKLEK